MTAPAGAIRIADPATLGPALAQIRALLGLSRSDLGRLVEADTGRDMLSVVKQVQQWDDGRHSPTASSLGPVLRALGYDLALIPREDSDVDSDSARTASPQAAQDGSGVVPPRVGAPDGSEARTGGAA